MTAALYGLPPPALAPTPADAVQTSPLHPGAPALEGLAAASLDEALVLAPAGVVERRFVLAAALRALRPGGRLTALAPKDRGGARLRKELAGFGLDVAEHAKAHHRICVSARPEALTGVAEALTEGGPQQPHGLGGRDRGLWSQPGVFSWDRPDPGSLLLLEQLPALTGQGVDLGCGVGLLSAAVLARSPTARLLAVDLDRRAVAAARRNLPADRVELRWADVRTGLSDVSGLDFAVCNPPFHLLGGEDRALGGAFIAAAAAALHRGGVLWLVANRHLPYEAPLAAAFKRVEVRAEANGFKVFEAVR